MCNLRTALARRPFLRLCRHHPAHHADDRTRQPQQQAKGAQAWRRLFQGFKRLADDALSNRGQSRKTGPFVRV
jgi:hypothetical protein